MRCREAGLPAVPSAASLGRDWCRIPRFPPQSAFRSDRSDQFTRSDSAGFGGLAAGAPPQMFPRCAAAVSRRQKWPIMSSRLANYYSALQSVGRSKSRSIRAGLDFCSVPGSIGRHWVRLLQSLKPRSHRIFSGKLFGFFLWKCQKCLYKKADNQKVVFFSLRLQNTIART